ncbi:MAG: hypothetical protein RRC07_12320 [Anaerolineae bacterium]|nr:hypothetical protein [Anaerolineae bacterium]
MAAGSKTDFTATETWAYDIDPGREFYPDGRFHLRDSVGVFIWEADDDRLDGANIVVVNWNFVWMPESVFVSGPIWGSFFLSNDGGSWEGSWTGVRDENGFSYFHYVGHGRGGYEGLQLRAWGERLTPDGAAPEDFHGTILETGG